jgi:hypothetical protein
MQILKINKKCFFKGLTDTKNSGLTIYKKAKMFHKVPKNFYIFK